MRVLAFYIKSTLPILRRVKAPFSVLQHRNYAFTFYQGLQFQPELGLANDLVVVQNLLLSTDEELQSYEQLAREKAIIYDLTDSQLLHHEAVQDLVRLSTAVTVPNQYLKKDVELFAKRVKVVPSTLDVPYFTSARPKSRPTSPIIGCFGPHDWHLVKPVIEQVRARHPQVHFWGDEIAVEALGELVTPVQYTVDSYPAILQSTVFGLCPCEGYTSLDTIWAHEYGVVCRPVIASSNSAYSQISSRGIVLVHGQEGWIKAIGRLLREPHERAILGQYAFEAANAQRNTILAGRYAQIYRDLLPHLP